MNYAFGGLPNSHCPHIAQCKRRQALAIDRELFSEFSLNTAASGSSLIIAGKIIGSANRSSSGVSNLSRHQIDPCSSRRNPSIARNNNISGDNFCPRPIARRKPAPTQVNCHRRCEEMSHNFTDKVLAPVHERSAEAGAA